MTKLAKFLALSISILSNLTLANQIEAIIENPRKNLHYFEGQSLNLKCLFTEQNNFARPKFSSDQKQIQSTNNKNSINTQPDWLADLNIFKQKKDGSRKDILVKGQVAAHLHHSSVDYELSVFADHVILSISSLPKSVEGFQFFCELNSNPIGLGRSQTDWITVRSLPFTSISYASFGLEKNTVGGLQETYQIDDPQNFFKVNFNHNSLDKINTDFICRVSNVQAPNYMDLSFYLDDQIIREVSGNDNSGKMIIDSFAEEQSTIFTVDADLLRRAGKVGCGFSWPEMDYSKMISSRIAVLDRPNVPVVRNLGHGGFVDTGFYDERLDFLCENADKVNKPTVYSEMTIKGTVFEIITDRGQNVECLASNSKSQGCYYRPLQRDQIKTLSVKCKIRNSLGFSDFSQPFLVKLRARSKISNTDKISIIDNSVREFQISRQVPDPNRPGYYMSKNLDQRQKMVNTIVCNFQNPESIIFEKYDRTYESWETVSRGITPKYQVIEAGLYRCREYYDKNGVKARKITFKDMTRSGQVSYVPLDGLNSELSKIELIEGRRAEILEEHRIFLACGYDGLALDTEINSVEFLIDGLDGCSGSYEISKATNVRFIFWVMEK